MAATYTTTVTVTMPSAANGTAVKFEVAETFLSTASEIYERGTTYTATLSSGSASVALPVPDNTGASAARYYVTGVYGDRFNPVPITVVYSASSVNLTTLIDAADADVDALTTLLGSYLLTANGVDSVKLAALTSAGATSATLSRIPDGLRIGQYVVIDAWTTQAELRKITAVSGATASWTTGLTYAHALGDNVILTDFAVVAAAWFGTVGDDSTDDTAALTLMLDELSNAGGGLALAPDTYMTTLPVLMRANVTLDGLGRGMIHNTSATTTRAVCVFFGLHHPVLNDNYTLYNLSDISIGDTQITCSTPAQAGNFVVGQPLMIRSAAFFHEETLQKPQMVELNRAKAIDTDTGIITLDYPIGQSITSARAAYTQNAVLFESRYSYICDRATLRNMRVKSDNGNWIQRIICIDCLIENIEIVESQDFIIGNAMARTRVRGLRGVFGDRAFEIKTGAHDSIIENCLATYDSRLDTGGTALLIDTGEYNRDLVFRNIRINAAGWNGSDIITPRGDGATIADCEIYAPGATGSAIAIYSQALEPTNGNIIENCRITAGGGASYIRIGTVNNSYTATVSGAPTTTITAAGNDFSEQQSVRLTTTGTLPAPLATGTTYWIVDDAGNDLQLAATSGGSAITFTDSGSGTHTITRYYFHPTGNVIRNCDFIGGASSQSILAGGGTGNLVIGNRFAGTQAGFNSQSTQFAQNRIAGNYGLGSITGTTEAEQGLNDLSGNRGDERFVGAQWFNGWNVLVESQTSGYVVATMTLPVGVVVQTGDVFHFVIRAHFVNTGGVKNIRLIDTTNASVILARVVNYTGSGGVLIHGYYAMRGNTSADRNFVSEMPDGTRDIVESAPGTMDFLTNGWTLELQAWCATGANSDAIRFSEYRSWVTGPLS